MPTLNLLYADHYDINEQIKVRIPTVGEVIGQEDTYYSLVHSLTAAPIDMLVQLDDVGIDFSTINDFELFQLMFNGIASMDTSLIFGDLDLSRFQPMVNIENKTIVLRDDEKDITIDRMTHAQIAAVLRKIHHLERNNRKPGNEEARKYMIERARIKAKRHKRTQDSQLESLIIAMVNTEQYKYNYAETLGLSIYQFNESVRQITAKVRYDNLMHGVYSGTIAPKDVSDKEMNWLTHQ